MRGVARKSTELRQFFCTRGGGDAASHAEEDLKDTEATTCEHRRGMFEVAPPLTPPQPLPDPYQLPLPPPSFYPIWLGPPRSLGWGGVEESSVAVRTNDAPLPNHPHTHPHIRTHTPFPLQTNCCSDSWGPLAAPHWGESPTDTFLFPHSRRRWLTGWNTEAPHVLPCRHSP